MLSMRWQAVFALTVLLFLSACSDGAAQPEFDGPVLFYARLDPDGNSWRLHATDGLVDREIVHVRDSRLGGLVGSPVAAQVAIIEYDVTAQLSTLAIRDIEGRVHSRLEGPIVAASGIGPLVAWSRNGEQIGFTHADGRNLSLRIADSETGELTTPDLLNDLRLQGPSWSVDDELLAAVTGEDFERLVVISLPDGEVSDLTEEPEGTKAMPVWSPDGAWVAYFAQPDELGSSAQGPLRESVWLVPSVGGAPRKLTNAAFLSPQAWSPDSTQLAIACSDGSAVTDLCLVDIETGSIEIAVEGAPDARILSPGFSPDSSQIAYVAGSTLNVLDLGDGEITKVADGVMWLNFSWSAN